MVCGSRLGRGSLDSPLMSAPRLRDGSLEWHCALDGVAVSGRDRGPRRFHAVDLSVVGSIGCRSRACCFLAIPFWRCFLYFTFWLSGTRTMSVGKYVFYLGGSSATPSGHLVLVAWPSRFQEITTFAWDECFLSPRYKYLRLTPSCETSFRLARFISMLGQSGGS